MNDIRLLLVDDESDFRNALSRRLGRRGFDPLQAGSGEACLGLLDEQPADVVVLDVKMPGMDGMEVLRRIKAKYPRTQVILLTGQASASDGVEGIKSGAFDYLSKPVELDHLAAKIKQAHEKTLREAEKRQEAEFRARMERQLIAAERLASLGTLAAGVAHEINNPLAIIRESAGWISQLLKREELSGIPCREDFYKALEKIAAAVERAKKITHQLLGVVREPEACVSQVNMAELVDETVQLVRRRLKDKNIQVVQNTTAMKDPLWSDPNQLRQVIINLLTNAIHASGENEKIFITISSTDRHIVLEVEDTGVGIPEENLSRIFEPFFTTKSPDQGTGLGLFVTRGMVEKLGGKIVVESRLGRGSRFRVHLPRCPNSKKKLQDDTVSSMLKAVQGDRSDD